MSWWENAKGWGSDIGKSTVNWGSGLLNNKLVTTSTNLATWSAPLVKQVALGTISFTFHTIANLFEQISVVPKVAYSVVFHPKTQMVAGHVLHIACEDLLPLVIVSYTNDMIQRHGRNYLDSSNNPGQSTDMVFQTGLWLLQAASLVYKTRKTTQMLLRTAVLSIEAGNALTDVNKNLPKDVCIAEECPTLRFIKGSFRYTAAFWATECAIELIKYIPGVGGATAALLSIHHRGRYILTIALPDLCNRHHVEYLKEHVELAFALGIGHAATTDLVNYGIEASTAALFSLFGTGSAGIPAVYYESMVRQFMMLTAISVAAHMHLPHAVKKSLRTVIDPVAFFQDGVGFSFDTIVYGLKKQVPRLLQQPPSSIRWGELAEYARLALQHPYVKEIEFFAVPRMLRSKQAFINDPVIAPNWEGLRQTGVSYMGGVEEIKKAKMTQVAAYAPGTTSRIISAYKNIPRSVIKLLMAAMANKIFMNQFGDVRRQLEGLRPNGGSEVIADPDALQLRKNTPEESQLPPISVIEESEDKNKLQGFEVINPLSKLKEPSSHPKIIQATPFVIPRSPSSSSSNQPSAEKVIRSRPGLFSQSGASGTRGIIRTRPLNNEENKKEDSNAYDNGLFS